MPMGVWRAALPPGSWMGPDRPRTEQEVSGAALSQPEHVARAVQGLEGTKLASGCLAQPCSGFGTPHAPASRPRFSHLAPTSTHGSLPAQRSSPVLHHVHHHPVGGVHRLANQVLEEDEGLHEEVLPVRRRCQELGLTMMPSQYDVGLSIGARSIPRHLTARASPPWSGDVGCAEVYGRRHQCRVQAGHWDQWNAPAEKRGGDAGRFW